MTGPVPNDLTQTTFGISRDDSVKFIPFYIEHDIYKADPSLGISPPKCGILSAGSP